MKLIINVPEDYYGVIKKIDDDKCTADMLIIKYGIPIPETATILSVTEFADRCRICGQRKVIE